MNNIIKVLRKVVTHIEKCKPCTVIIDDNFECSYEGEEVFSDSCDDHVTDDNDRFQWYAAVRVARNANDLDHQTLQDIMVKILGEPYRKITRNDGTPPVNNWVTGRGYVLVVHHEECVEFFENYTQASVKVNK